MIQKLKSLFKIGRLEKSDDNPDLRNGWFFYEGKEIKGTLFTPYGIMHNPPKGAITMLFSQNGQESNAIGIADDPRNRIFKGDKKLEPGELAIGHYTTGSYVFFKNDENTYIFCKKDENTNITNDLNKTIGNNSTTEIGSNKSLAVDGDMTIDVGGGITINVGSSITITIGAMTAVFDSAGLTVTGGDVVADGISLKNHIHIGDSGGLTQPPVG